MNSRSDTSLLPRNKMFFFFFVSTPSCLLAWRVFSETTLLNFFLFHPSLKNIFFTFIEGQNLSEAGTKNKGEVLPDKIGCRYYSCSFCQLVVGSSTTLRLHSLIWSNSATNMIFLKMSMICLWIFYINLS